MTPDRSVRSLKHNNNISSCQSNDDHVEIIIATAKENWL